MTSLSYQLLVNFTDEHQSYLLEKRGVGVQTGQLLRTLLDREIYREKNTGVPLHSYAPLGSQEFEEAGVEEEEADTSAEEPAAPSQVRRSKGRGTRTRATTPTTAPAHTPDITG